MAEDYYADLREFIEALQQRGRLYRWKRAVNKDSELMPLMRLQYRGLPDAQRQAFLFENVIDGKERKYDMKVVTGMSGASREILALGMGCNAPARDLRKVAFQAVAEPKEPALVERAAIQDHVYMGARLDVFGLTICLLPLKNPASVAVLVSRLHSLPKTPKPVRETSARAGDRQDRCAREDAHVRLCRAVNREVIL